MRTNKIKMTMGALLAASLLAACGGGGGGGGGDSATGATTSPPDSTSASAPSGSGAAAHCTAFTAAVVDPMAGLLAFPASEAHPMHAVTPLSVAPMLGGNTGPYAPSDFRAAYNFPSMPANLATASAAERAALGEGQTIYIVVAYHDPQVLSYLDTYSQRFGLPTCSRVTIDQTTGLPLANAGAGCSVSVVGADMVGNVAPLPGANAPWGQEEAMDLQLAHAAAPLARKVVVAAQGPDFASLNGAVTLANRMGNGVVAMSWGADDDSSYAAFDAYYRAPGMTYVAASGDSGYDGGAVSWPAAIPTVLAVGGTTLNWDGSTRSEKAWALGGGGMSSWRAVPAYQQGYSVASNGATCTAPLGRMVPDVALNADAGTGYAVYMSANGTTGWFMGGGTSAAVPVWSGLVASGNGMRGLAGKSPIASLHQALYRNVGLTQAIYTAGFNDVTTGSNGNCATCNASGGYDAVTGLGTPNAASLLGALAGQ